MVRIFCQGFYSNHSISIALKSIYDVQNFYGRLLEHVFDYHTNTDTNPTENDIFLQSLEDQPKASSSNSDISMDYSQFFTLFFENTVHVAILACASN